MINSYCFAFQENLKDQNWINALDQYQQEVNKYTHLVQLFIQCKNNQNMIYIKNLKFLTNILYNDHMLTFLFNAKIPIHWILSIKKINNDTVCLFCVNVVAKNQIKKLLLQYYVSEKRCTHNQQNEEF